MAAVELRGVRYAYPGTPPVLNGLDLSLAGGRATVIFGASGSGKSTVAYLLNGLIPHFFGGSLEGAVMVGGTDTRQTSVGALVATVGLVIQNADAQLFNATVMEDLAFGLESLGLLAPAIEVRIGTTASELGIGHLLDRSPETLSGGEKKMAAVAAALCMDPAVMVLDEPFAGLDWHAARVLRDLLIRTARRGKNLIIIEHRPRPALDVADRCLVIDRGRIRYDGPPRSAAVELAERHLIPHYPRRTGVTGSPASETVLAVRHLACRRGRRQILVDISLTIRTGESLAIVGENGAGKTTLVTHMAGLLPPYRGEVLFKGRPIGSFAPRTRAAGVGICFQNPNDQFFRTDVRQEIMDGARRLERTDADWQQKIIAALNLDSLMDRSPYRLSEGEKKRVALASVLLMRPQVLLLDEPTAGQDGRCKEALAGILAFIALTGTATVMVTHDLEFAAAVADRWLWLQEGRIRADGGPRDIREKLGAAFSVPVSDRQNFTGA
ncbi:MAG: ABC transporter ATP-binding protein [Desulfobacterales bacterium]